MNVEVFALCDYAHDERGKLTVVGAFDALMLNELPAVHPLLCIALRLRFQVYELGSHEIMLTLKDENGQPAASPLRAGIEVNGIGRDSACANLALRLFNLRWEREGRWHFLLEIDGHEKAQLPLYVYRNPQA